MPEQPDQLDGSTEPSPIGRDYKDLAEARREAPWPEHVEASERAVDRVMVEDRADMIATVANNEAKALTLAAMANRTAGSLSKGDIYRLFIAMQGDDPSWGDMHQGGPGGYAENTFVPVGTVAKEEHVTPGGAVRKRFEVTPYGEKIGLATVGMMLDLSLKYPDDALYQVFGKTGKPADAAHRAPYARIQILSDLAHSTADYMQVKQLAEHAGIGNASGPIDELEDAGLVEVERYAAGESDLQIVIPDRQAFAAQHVRPEIAVLRAKLQDFLLSQEPSEGEIRVGVEDVYSYAATVEPDTPTDELRTKVSQAMGFWMRKGVLKKHYQKFNQEQRSMVKLKPDKAAMVNDMLFAVQALVEADEGLLELGQQRALEIVNDPELVNQLLDKAKASSPFANRESQEDFEARIMGLIKDQELPIERITEMVEKGGKPISDSRVGVVLAEMAARGLVERRTVGQSLLYQKAGASHSDTPE